MADPGPKLLMEALLAAQDKMPAIDKNATNPFHNSKYMTADHLFAKALPVLRAQGVLVTQWPTVLDGQPALRTRLDHAPSGEWAETTMLLAVDKPGPQAYGAALTYAKRYALGSILCVSTETDDDANAAEDSASMPEEAADSVAAGDLPTGHASSDQGSPSDEVEGLTAAILAAAETLQAFDAVYADLVEKEQKAIDAKRQSPSFWAWLRSEKAGMEELVADWQRKNDLVEA